MSLNDVKVGDLIHFVDNRNSEGLTNILGVNNKKEFMPSQADTETVDNTKYKIIGKNQFVFSGMQTGRDKCIRISLYKNNELACVSPAYSVFEVNDPQTIIPDYLFMYFNSDEKDRLGWFLSDASIRANLDLDRFCEISIDIPSVEIQQKYVDIYNALLAKQLTNEASLTILENAFKCCMFKIKNEFDISPIGPYIELCMEKNDDLKYGIDSVRGISIDKKFITTKADMTGVNLKPYLLVEPGSFAYVSVTSRNGEKISLALNDTKETYICSSSYIAFKPKKNNILDPHYLMLFFSQDEFNRYARFHSWGSARETFDWDSMCNVSIPIPPIEKQQAIAKIYKVYRQRKEINTQLKSLLKRICPVLIKGSIEEAKRT